MPKTTVPPTSGTVQQPSALARAVGEVAFYREHHPSFGPYLRQLRLGRGLEVDPKNWTTR